MKSLLAVVICVVSLGVCCAGRAQQLSFDQLIPTSHFEEVLKSTAYVWSDLRWCSERNFKPDQCQAPLFCNRMIGNLMAQHRSLVKLEGERVGLDAQQYLVQLLGMTASQFRLLDNSSTSMCNAALETISSTIAEHVKNLVGEQR